MRYYFEKKNVKMTQSWLKGPYKHPHVVITFCHNNLSSNTYSITVESSAATKKHIMVRQKYFKRGRGANERAFGRGAKIY